jgi:hypothetical protein
MERKSRERLYEGGMEGAFWVEVGGRGVGQEGLEIKTLANQQPSKGTFVREFNRPRL